MNVRTIKCRKCGAIITWRRFGSLRACLNPDGTRHRCSSSEVREQLRALGELYQRVEANGENGLPSEIDVEDVA